MKVAKYEKDIQSSTVEEWRAGKIKRLTMAEARKAVAMMSKEEIAAMEAEDAYYDFEGLGTGPIFRGPILGRPKKEIKREVAAIRIPADALKEIKALGKGWSPRAGDALARLVKEGAL
jgi:uncharacterized protein (DUF4415 family)